MKTSLSDFAVDEAQKTKENRPQLNECDDDGFVYRMHRDMGKIADFFRHPIRSEEDKYKKLSSKFAPMSWTDRGMRIVADKVDVNEGFSYYDREATRCGLEGIEEATSASIEEIYHVVCKIDEFISQGHWAGDIIDRSYTTPITIRKEILLGEKKATRTAWFYKEVKTRMVKLSNKANINIADMIVLCEVYALVTSKVLPGPMLKDCEKVITRWNWWLNYRLRTMQNLYEFLQKGML